MVAQVDFEKVNKTVIERYRTFYKVNIPPERIDAIIIDLQEYTEQELDEAMIVLRRKISKAPTPQQIIDECKEVRKKTGNPKVWNHNAPLPIWAKEKKVYNLVQFYLSTWRPSVLADQAREEGWFDNADAYMREVAPIQASYIVGVIRGFSCSIIFPHLSYPTPEADMKDFFDEQRTQSVKGEISITFPPGLVLHWKKWVEIRRRNKLPPEEYAKALTAAATQVPESKEYETSHDF